MYGGNSLLTDLDITARDVIRRQCCRLVNITQKRLFCMMHALGLDTLITLVVESCHKIVLLREALN